MKSLIFFVLIFFSSCALKSESKKYWKYKYCNDRAITQEEECEREFKRQLRSMHPAPDLSQEVQQNEYKHPQY